MAQIQVKRGTSAQLTSYGNLNVGELGYTTDTRQLYIGTGVSNKLVSGLEIVSIDDTDSPYSAKINQALYANSSSGAITVTLPAAASIGDRITITDTMGSFSVNNITIGRNSHNINGESDDFLLDMNYTDTELVYVNATIGWLIKPGGVGAFAGSDTLDCGSFV